MVNNEFASWLRETRQARGLTRANLAKAVGVATSSIAYWENARRRPLTLETRARLVEALDTLPPRHDTLASFGEWLRERRERAGWNKSDLARRLGTWPSSVTRWESGYNQPRIVFCTLLAWSFDVPLAEVLERAGYEQEEVSDPLTLIAPARIHNPVSGKCERCPALGPCERDLNDGLPVWCEYVDVNDLFVAHSTGRVRQLMARYEDFFTDREMAGDAHEPARHAAAVPAGAD